jgi:hypothetical protein
MIIAYVIDYKASEVAGISTMAAQGVGHLRDDNKCVMNDEGSELWTCSIAFDIPIRYINEVRQDIMWSGRQMPTKKGAQINVVLLSLQAIARIGLPDFSSLNIEALCEYSLDVP